MNRQKVIEAVKILRDRYETEDAAYRAMSDALALLESAPPDLTPYLTAAAILVARDKREDALFDRVFNLARALRDAAQKAGA